jgi:hypothetical protein
VRSCMQYQAMRRGSMVDPISTMVAVKDKPHMQDVERQLRF